MSSLRVLPYGGKYIQFWRFPAGDQLLAEFGLTSARWQVLGAVALSGAPQPVASIARNMGLTRQAVQRVVARRKGKQGLNVLPMPPSSSH